MVKTRPINIKNYTRIKNKKEEKVKKHIRNIKVSSTNETIREDIKFGKAKMLFEK